MADQPKLTALRELLSDAWVDSEIFGEKPHHLLGQWWQNKPDNVWLPYAESLAEILLGSDRLTMDRAALAAKLKAEYLPTLAEIETAVHLLQAGFTVTLEPFAPARGADIQASLEGVDYFLEVRAVGDADDVNRFNAVSAELFGVLNGIPSHYFAAITVGDEYVRGGQRLREAERVLQSSLMILAEEQWPRATLYFSPEGGKLLNPHGNYNEHGAAAKAAYTAMVEAADFVVRFRNVGKACEKTAASAARPFQREPEPDQTHARLRKILSKKKDQLPKESRGIIVIESTDLFMLNDFSIAAALYGDLMVHFEPVGPGEPVGQPIGYRNARGFFGKTSRVSAVLFHERSAPDGEVRHQWLIYPTNRANADTIRLSKSELQRLGDLQDRKNLASDAAESPVA